MNASSNLNKFANSLSLSELIDAQPSLAFAPFWCGVYADWLEDTADLRKENQANVVVACRWIHTMQREPYVSTFRIREQDSITWRWLGSPLDRWLAQDSKKRVAPTKYHVPLNGAHIDDRSLGNAYQAIVNRLATELTLSQLLQLTSTCERVGALSGYSLAEGS